MGSIATETGSNISPQQKPQSLVGNPLKSFTKSIEQLSRPGILKGAAVGIREDSCIAIKALGFGTFKA